MDILVLHGPNLNLLGTREPATYGTETLADINEQLQSAASSANLTLEARQSNAENVLVEWIQESARQGARFLIINPAAFTHTSVAMRDALAAVDLPFIEVHISNVYAREAFRRQSYFSDLAVGVISGLGGQGYLLALEAARTRLNTAG